MMETILNLGLNDATVEALARRRRRALRVRLVPPLRADVRRGGAGRAGRVFEERLTAMKAARGVERTRTCRRTT
jgi:hypothetical protein